ncbi:MAG TPA: TfuA-like protein [Devosia sp.]|nr:TfuA-like protein [Devosia sp.]
MLAGLDLRGPAGRGAILRAVEAGAQAIGLVDGIYEHEPAVWHKEILYALAQGVPVLGAASMGALRAAECAAFGMVGVGSIFREYLKGVRTADADVAVAHGPAEFGYQPLSVALVDAESALAALPLAPRDRARLVARARALHFKDRTWDAICRDDRLAAAAAAIPSRKTSDAVGLIGLLRESQFARPPQFELNVTGYLTGLARDLGIRLSRS